MTSVRSAPQPSPQRSRTALRGVRRELLVAGSFLGWAVCFTIAMRMLRSGMVADAPLTWIVAAAPSLAAIGVLVGYTRYLRAIDELQRLIQLQALAWGFGGGFFAICGYLPFVLLGAPALDAATATTVLAVVFSMATLAGAWRYR